MSIDQSHQSARPLHQFEWVHLHPPANSIRKPESESKLDVKMVYPDSDPHPFMAGTILIFIYPGFEDVAHLKFRDPQRRTYAQPWIQSTQWQCHAIPQVYTNTYTYTNLPTPTHGYTAYAYTV